jgi:transcriptional regulator with XRE-family HTH domain
MHLAEFMEKRQLFDDDVAEAIGVSRPTISRIRRKLARPDWATIKKLRQLSRGKVMANDFVDLPGDGDG